MEPIIANTDDYAKIATLADQLRAGQTVELEVRHHFANGVYARELHIPAGIALVGMIHKTANLNICSKGRIKVFGNGQVAEFSAGDHIVSPPGTQRAAVALEYTIWTTIHATTLTDVDEIEKIFVCRDREQYMLHCQSLQQLEG